MNASTARSTPMLSASPAGCIDAGTRRTSTGIAHHANRTPAVPATTASTRLSVSDCATSRDRPAPSATRTAISCRRPTARATSRFATLTHAISSTRLTAASSRSSARFVSPTSAVAHRQREVLGSLVLGRDVPAPSAARSSSRSSSACAIDTPGASRPTANIHPFFRCAGACAGVRIGTIDVGAVVGGKAEARAPRRRRPAAQSRPILIERPTIDGSPPKRSRQTRSRASTTGAAPCAASAAFSARPEHGARAQHVEEVGRGLQHADVERFSCGEDRRRTERRTPASDSNERCRARRSTKSPIAMNVLGDAGAAIAMLRAARAGPTSRIRQRAQQRRVDHGEDRDVGADAERQRQDRRDREAALAHQQAQRVTDVVEEHREDLRRRQPPALEKETDRGQRRCRGRCAPRQRTDRGARVRTDRRAPTGGAGPRAAGPAASYASDQPLRSFAASVPAISVE